VAAGVVRAGTTSGTDECVRKGLVDPVLVAEVEGAVDEGPRDHGIVGGVVAPRPGPAEVDGSAVDGESGELHGADDRGR
jgi:hypothetical protein